MDWTGEADRRSFVRKSLAGICACGCGGGLLASAPGEAAASSAAASGPEAPTATTQDSTAMPRMWIAVLAESLAEGDPEDARRLLKGCSASHWEHLGMDATLQPFQGNVPAFLDFLRSEWGWIIEYDPEAGLIQVNENKSDCVCPLVSGQRGRELGMLCYCSEGFAERLFGAVAGGVVRAEVTESILRGGERCRYRIRLQA